MIFLKVVLWLTISGQHLIYSFKKNSNTLQSQTLVWHPQSQWHASSLTVRLMDWHFHLPNRSVAVSVNSSLQQTPSYAVPDCPLPLRIKWGAQWGGARGGHEEVPFCEVHGSLDTHRSKYSLP